MQRTPRRNGLAAMYDRIFKYAMQKKPATAK